MKLELRQAGLADLPLLLQWRLQVLQEVFPGRVEERQAELLEANRAYYQAQLPQGGHIACFAYLGDGIVGCGGLCLYRELPSPDNPGGLCGYLMNIYTLPAWRGQGIGGQVVAWLIAQARARGVGKLYLEASASGKSLYRQLGFKDMQDYLLWAGD